MKFKLAYILGGIFAIGAYAQFGGKGAANVAIHQVTIASDTASQFPPASVDFTRGFEVHIASAITQDVFIATFSTVCNGISCDTTASMPLLKTYPISFPASDGTPIFFFSGSGTDKKMSGIVYK